MSKPKKPENVHYACHKQDCQRMAQMNQWTLLRVEPTGDRILKAKCVFCGEQTSFLDYTQD